MSTTDSAAVYAPRHHARSEFIHARGLRHHVLVWGDLAQASAAQPLLVLAHGWMDVGASFQFMVDALRQLPGFETRPVAALDWRGFGQSDSPACESYYFPDYLGDLDALLDHLSPEGPVDLLGHSMGGNAVMLYAGARPGRVRRLVNLEGFGMPATAPDDAPGRYVQWLDALKEPVRLKDYASLEEVATRLQTTNPRLKPPLARWLAAQWARQEGGRWVINADPVHKRPQPLLYRVEEATAFMRCLTMPVLFVEGAQTLYFTLFGARYSRDEFLARIKAVADFRLETLQEAGHMLHHDQPEALADHIAAFLSARLGDCA